MEDRETDWKHFRKLREIALERFYERAVTKFSSMVQQPSKSNEERYHELYTSILEEDKELATMFDNPRRSMADLHLLAMVRADLLSQEELAQFSDLTLARLKPFLGDEF